MSQGREKEEGFIKTLAQKKIITLKRMLEKINQEIQKSIRNGLVNISAVIANEIDV